MALAASLAVFETSKGGPSVSTAAELTVVVVADGSAALSLRLQPASARSASVPVPRNRNPRVVILARSPGSGPRYKKPARFWRSDAPVWYRALGKAKAANPSPRFRWPRAQRAFAQRQLYPPAHGRHPQA